MTTHPSPSDATVEKCLNLGHGFHEYDRTTVLEILDKLDHRFTGIPAETVRLELMVKDREHNDQKVTLEGHVAGMKTVVATATDEDVWVGLAHVRDEFLRQFNAWQDQHRR